MDDLILLLIYIASKNTLLVCCNLGIHDEPILTMFDKNVLKLESKQSKDAFPCHLTGASTMHT